MLATPLTAHFEVTHVCNNHCPHCYASSWLFNDTISKPTNPSPKKLIQIAEAIVSNEIFDVVITGGEPLALERATLYSIMDIFVRNNIRISLNTNGRLLSLETCNQLRLHGLGGVLISLHSWNDELHNNIVDSSYAAKQTKLGISNAIASGLSVNVNQVVGEKNISTMMETALELEAMGVNSIAFTRMLSPLGVDSSYNPIAPKEFLDRFFLCRETIAIPCTSLLPIPYCADERIPHSKLNLSCSGGITSCAIACDGNVRFCPQDNHSWGNILKEDLASIWKRITEWRKQESLLPDSCRKCCFIDDCRGGCRVAAESHFSNYDAMDPWASKSQHDYQRKVIHTEFDVSAKYMITPKLRTRYDTASGNHLLYWGKRFTLVNEDAIDTLKQLPKSFIPEKLIETNIAPPHVISFIRDMYKSGAIIRIKER